MRWTDRKTELYVSLVARATDEQLARLMRAPFRRVLLWQIFRTIAARLDPRRAARVQAVLEFRIGGGPHESDRYQVEVAGGRASARRDGALEPDVIITIGAVAFLRLTSGSSGWLELFVRRRLQVEGSKLLAVRFPAMFRIPRAAEPRRDLSP